MSSGVRTCLNALKLRKQAQRTARLITCTLWRNYSAKTAAAKRNTEPDDNRYDLLSVSFRFDGLKKEHTLKENDVKELFPNAVSYNLPNIKGQSKLLGHGIVTYSSESVARQAIEKLNGKVQENGTVLCVEKALRPAEEWLTLDMVKIPKKIKRTPTSILEALASTVGKDYTGDYYFVDDPTFYPRFRKERYNNVMGQLAGRRAAQYIIQQHDDLFQHNPAVPETDAFKPKLDVLQLTDTSEEALVERIQKKKTKLAIEMHKELISSGTPVSENVQLMLLDLLTFYNSKDPKPEKDPEELYIEELKYVEVDPTMGYKNWDPEGYAEELFILMAEGNQISHRAYNSMLKGRTRYQSTDEAFVLYAEMLQKKIPVDLEAYNLLIPLILQTSDRDGIKRAKSIMKDMKDRGVAPNYNTFHNYIYGLFKLISGRYVIYKEVNATLNEMKAVGLEPCLGTWCIASRVILKEFRNQRDFGSALDYISQMLDQLEGKQFTPKSTLDYQFFPELAKHIEGLKDIDSVYRLHDILHTGNNYRFLSTSDNEQTYHLFYWYLIKDFESLDKIMETFHTLVPKALFLGSGWIPGFITENLSHGDGYKYVPQLWEGTKGFRENEVPKALLKLMAKKKHDPELQETFVNLAKEMYKKLIMKDPRSKATGATHVLGLHAKTASHLIQIYLNGEEFSDAWEIFENYYKKREGVLGVFKYGIAGQLLDLVIEKKDVEKCIMCFKVIRESEEKEFIDESKEKLLSADLDLTDLNRNLIESIAS